MNIAMMKASFIMNKKLIRKEFRDSVFARDKYTCVCCGAKGKDRQGSDLHKKYHKNVPDEKLVDLDSHHITPREELANGGYVKENGITLCDSGCHIKAEDYLQERDQADPNFAPAHLYKLIGSSFEEAVLASEKL